MQDLQSKTLSHAQHRRARPLQKYHDHAQVLFYVFLTQLTSMQQHQPAKDVSRGPATAEQRTFWDTGFMTLDFLRVSFCFLEVGWDAGAGGTTRAEGIFATFAEQDRNFGIAQNRNSFKKTSQRVEMLF